MEHLWQSIHASQATIRVPCLCDPQMVFEEPVNFKEYGQKEEFDFNLLFEPLTLEKKRRIWAFMQEWLFFAILSAILQVPIRVADFMSQDESGPYLDTTELRTLLRQWQSHIRAMDEATAKQYITESLEILELSSSFQRGLEALEIDEDHIWAPIALSLALLGQVLTTSIYRTFAGEQFKPYLKVITWPSSTLLDDQLREARWCPHAITMLASGLGLMGAHFASLVSWADEGLKHASCSNDDCVAYQVDESTYKTSHVNGCSDCDFITFGASNADSVTEILRADNVPVIDIAAINFEAKTVNLSAEPATSRSPYVAISHVWSHGLGNPRSNSLPRCQLMRLAKYIGALSVQASSSLRYLWIDTLCIPVQGEGRKLGIAKLRDTYCEAATVLVLDATLTSTHLNSQLIDLVAENEMEDAATVSAVEALLRIVVAPWTKRLWTFQEGVLGNNILFQFANAAISGDTLMSSFQGLADREVENDLFYRLVARFEFFLQRHEAFEGPHRLAALARCLQWRKTSKSADETICLGNVLGFPKSDVRRILDTPAEFRMPLFLSMVKKVPSDIIFGEVERLQIPGYSWAPRTFLHTSSRASNFRMTASGSSIAFIRDEGLVLSAPALVFARDPARVVGAEFKVWILNETDSGCQYILRPSSSDLYFSNSILQRLQSMQSAMLAVLVCKPTNVPSLKDSEEAMNGLLCSVYHEDYEITYVQIICPVTTMLTVPANLFQESEFTTLGIETKAAPINATWCIMNE